MTQRGGVAPPHAPDVHGPLRKLLGDFHVTGLFWYRIHRWGMSVLPNWAISPVVNVFTAFFFVALRRIRRAIGSNLVPVLGECGWWERQSRIWKTMWTFAWCLSERYRYLGGKDPAALVAEGEEIWNKTLEEGLGVLVVTAHIGHWEIGSRLGLTRSGRLVHVVREAELDPRAQEFIQGLFEDVAEDGYRVHFLEDSSLAAGVQLRAMLLQGDIVAVQGDRPRSSGRTRVTDLFDRPFELPAGPAVLARVAGVPMLPIFVFREGRNRSRVVIRDAIRVEESGDSGEAVAAALQQFVDDLEWAIRRRPYQWFCFRELWPDEGVEAAPE